MTDPTPTRDEAVPTGWRYSINYGPDGEENFANVYAADGQFVGNLRTHHAIAICNAFAVCEKLASAPAPASGRVDAVAEVVAEELALKIVNLSVNWLREDGTDREYEDYVRANWTKEIAEAKRLILSALSPAATPVSEAEPVAWLHTLHMELGQTDRCLTFSPDNPFGQPGRDYSPEYSVTSEALAKPASSPAGGDDLVAWIESLPREPTPALRAAYEAYKASQSTSAGRVGE